MRLKDKVALVTGASRGIGLACAKAMAAEGAKIVLADIEIGAGETAAEEIQAGGGDAVFVACDVGDKRQVDAMVESARILAESLDGHVCDAQRSALTQQTIRHMR